MWHPYMHCSTIRRAAPRISANYVTSSSSALRCTYNLTLLCRPRSESWYMHETITPPSACTSAVLYRSRADGVHAVQVEACRRRAVTDGTHVHEAATGDVVLGTHRCAAPRHVWPPHPRGHRARCTPGDAPPQCCRVSGAGGAPRRHDPRTSPQLVTSRATCYRSRYTVSSIGRSAAGQGLCASYVRSMSALVGCFCSSWVWGG